MAKVRTVYGLFTHLTGYLSAIGIGVCLAGNAFGELKGLSESEMSEIDGTGIGVVLENFKFSHGTDQPDANGDRARVFRIVGVAEYDTDARYLTCFAIEEVAG